MPLVFVHGVNTRCGDTDEERKVFNTSVEFLKNNFKTAFSKRVEAPQEVEVYAPYWGKLGVTFKRNLACIPQLGIQELAASDRQHDRVMEATAAQLDNQLLGDANLAAAPLLVIARTRSLEAALTMLFAGASNSPVPGELINAAQLAALLPAAARFAAAAQAYVSSIELPDEWLDGISDDEEFIAKLVHDVKREMDGEAAVHNAPKHESLGDGKLKIWLQNGALSVKHSIGKVTAAMKSALGDAAKSKSREGIDWLAGRYRLRASEYLGTFLGDVFTYLQNREPILKEVLEDVDAAVAAAKTNTSDKELYLVGHSFGGIILYDILSHYRKDKINCDLFVTVGSQVALFAEMDRLADKEGCAAFNSGLNAEIPRPPAINSWLNVFDYTDLIGFAANRVFSGVHDFSFKTTSYPILSHSHYFDTPGFFARLQVRVGDALTSGTDDPQPSQVDF